MFQVMIILKCFCFFQLRGIVFGDHGQLGHLVRDFAAGAEPKIDLAPRLLNGLVEPLVLDPEEKANLAIHDLVQVSKILHLLYY